MGQQISMEEAFPTFQRRCRELFEANLLLEAQVDTLTRQLEAVQQDNQRLQQAPDTPFPPTSGPDLAAPPASDEDR